MTSMLMGILGHWCIAGAQTQIQLGSSKLKVSKIGLGTLQACCDRATLFLKP